MIRLMLGILLLLPVIAQSDDIAEPNKIPALFEAVAKIHSIPPDIFYAMIRHESLRVIKTNGNVEALAWPWTINYRGKSIYFNSKDQAIAFAKSLINEGATNFDVGYGQINWKWHSNKFESIEDAFNPPKNLMVSAGILRKQFERKDCNGWVLALGCYHRPSQKSNKDKLIAHSYSLNVLRKWLEQSK